ncbi:hypothetical protein ACLMJK_009482 [Lecanora helva]
MASRWWLQPYKRRKVSHEETSNSPTRQAHHYKPYGLKILHPLEDSENGHFDLDIVAVHGLNGHRDETWTTDEGVNWLKDLLPKQIPRARIVTWGYDVNTHSSSELSKQYLYDHGRQLVSDLCLDRKLSKTEQRPIIFIAHSLGGIVVKSALLHSDSARAGALKEQKSVKLSTYGVVFMGTPHQGVDGVHFGQMLLDIGSVVMKTDDRVMKNLQSNSEWLQQQLGQYGQISNDFVTKFAYEIYKTPLPLGSGRLIVPRSSAVVPGASDAESIAIYANHFDMVKYRSSDDPGYKQVSGHLRLMAQESSRAIRKRWEGQEKLDASPQVDFSIPFSINGIPETNCFIGREEDLTALCKHFQGIGSKRKVTQLHGLGGVGKTQLALRFLRQRKDAYSAIFWLKGNDEDRVRQSFTKIANRIYEAYPAFEPVKTAIEAGDADKTIGAVKKWLSCEKNNAWMLVFDNVDNPMAYDTELYLPETDTGSILITSRSSRPAIASATLQSVKGFTDPTESVAVLSKTSGRLISQDDFAVRELLSEVEGLPLALATVGSYLKHHSMSLERYLEHYRNAWRKIQEMTPDLPSYDKALHTTWNLSLKYIQDRHPNTLAPELLKLWTYFDNNDLWFELLQAGKAHGKAPLWFLKLIEDEMTFNDALTPLCDLGLVHSLAIGGGYSLHSCVHMWATQLIDPSQVETLHALALQCTLYSIEGAIDSPSGALLIERTASHRLRAMTVRSGDHVNWSQVDCYIKEYIHLLKNQMPYCTPADTDRLFERMIGCLEKTFGPDDTPPPPAHSTLECNDVMAYAKELIKMLEGSNTLDNPGIADSYRLSALLGIFQFSFVDNEAGSATLIENFQNFTRQMQPEDEPFYLLVYSLTYLMNDLFMFFNVARTLIEAPANHREAALAYLAAPEERHDYRGERDAGSHLLMELEAELIKTPAMHSRLDS